MPNHETQPTMPDYSGVDVASLYSGSPKETQTVNGQLEIVPLDLQTVNGQLETMPQTVETTELALREQPNNEIENQPRWLVRSANRLADLANRFGNYMNGKRTVGEVANSITLSAQEKYTQGREIAGKVGSKVMDAAKFSGLILGEFSHGAKDVKRSYAEAYAQGKEQTKSYLINKASRAEERRAQRLEERQTKRAERRESITKNLEIAKLAGHILVSAASESIYSVGDQIKQKAVESKDTAKRGINRRLANRQQNISDSFQKRSINQAHIAALHEDSARRHKQAA